MGFQSSSLVLLIVLLAGQSTMLHGIRVDWNTNHGPIIPPTSTPAPKPMPPFREPAPVWEDISNDIPNPDPYRYVPPPPSRPRYNGNDAFSAPSATTFGSTASTLPANPTRPTAFYPSTRLTAASSAAPTAAQQPTYGNIVSRGSPQAASGQSQTVSSLAVKYVPNAGKQYVAVVAPAAAGSQQMMHMSKAAYLAGNEVYDKLNGKYNAKLKKYKAFEQKAKMLPYVTQYYKQQPNVYFNTQTANIAKRQWLPNQL